MAPLVLPTPAAVSISPGLLLPVAAIVILVVAIYLILLVMVLVVRQWLLARGFCAECCTCVRDEESPCYECFIMCAENCNCRIPSLSKSLDSCCPRTRDCGIGNCFPCTRCPFCDCACACQPPDCETINCICFEIKLR